MKLVLVWLSLAFSLFGLGCSGTPSGGSCEGATGYPSASACTSCLAQSCAMQISTCYGDGWQSSHFAGDCASYTACLCMCAVRDATCAVNCAPATSNACLTCQDQLAACVDASCKAACSATMTFDGGTGSIDGGASD